MSEELYLYYYFKPQVRDVSVIRCNASGNEDDGGTYLKISATRYYATFYTYSFVYADEYPNFCEIRYRYRQLPNGSYSDWTTVLASDDLSTNSVTTAALVGTLSADEGYEVIVGVLDDVGNTGETSIILPASVFMHRDGEMNSIAIGESVTEKNTVSIAENITAWVKGLLKIGGQIDFYNSNGVKGGYAKSGAIEMYSGDSFASITPFYIGVGNGATNYVTLYYDSQNKRGRVSIDGTPQYDSDAVTKAYVDSNFAPAGYGLGESYSPYFMTEGGADDITINGFYQTNINTPDSGYWLITHQTHTSTYMFQFAKKVSSTAMAVRTKHSGTWWEWEYINPPMQEGVEYRTTERYLGFPVYTKMYSMGTLANNTYKYIKAVPDGCRILRMAAFAGIGNGGLVTIPYESEGQRLWCYSTETSPVIYSNFDATAWSANIWIWYIKD